ncbi:MAG: hypothetical protein ACREQ5_41080, partial [Candidatus Dormibacteria bacterium]
MVLINKLTDRQKSRFPEFVARGTRIGLDCTPIDWGKFEDQLSLVYKCGGLKAPKEIIRCDSPLVMIKKIIAYEKKHKLNSVNNSVCNSVCNSVNNSVSNSVGDSVCNSVSDSVSDSVFDSVSDSVRNSVFNNICFGQQDAWYLSFYSYFREVCEL